MGRDDEAVLGAGAGAEGEGVLCHACGYQYPNGHQSAKEYANEMEARWPPDADGRSDQWHRGQERMAREVRLERAWWMRKQRRQLKLREEVPVVVLGGGDSPASHGGMAMDMEDDVRGCRDLGLDLPCDWTVEIPCYALSGVDTASSGGNSPVSGSWRISWKGEHTCCRSLNMIAFVKILNKFDKVTAKEVQQIYLKVVESSYYNNSDKAVRHMPLCHC